MYVEDVVDIMCRIPNSNSLLTWQPKSIGINKVDFLKSFLNLLAMCYLVQLPSMSHVVEIEIPIKKHKLQVLTAYKF